MKQPISIRLAVAVVALVALAMLAPVLRARVMNSLEAESHLYRGAEFANKGDPHRAEQEWQAAARLTPNNPEVFRALGTLYLAQKRFDEARKALNRLAELAPQEPHTLCELAEAELRAGTIALIESAAQDGERAAALEPRCARAQMVAGNAWFEKGDARRGLDYLRRAVKLNPADVPLTLHLIRVSVESQRLDEATEAAQNLTRRYPAFAQGYALLGTVSQLYPPNSPQARRTEEVLARALKLEPTNALAQAQMGHYFLGAGDAAKALRHLEAARLLNPHKTSLLYDLSRAYQTVGRKAEAEQAMSVFRRRSQIENEVAALEKRLVVEPSNQELLKRLAELANALGEPNRVRRFQP